MLQMANLNNTAAIRFYLKSFDVLAIACGTIITTIGQYIGV